MSLAYVKHWGFECIFGGVFFKKKAFCVIASRKQISFLTITNEFIFSKKNKPLCHLYCCTIETLF